jgi:hypothetical protein
MSDVWKFRKALASKEVVVAYGDTAAAIRLSPSVTSGAGAPSATKVAGSLYIDKTAGVLYISAGASWGALASVGTVYNLDFKGSVRMATTGNIADLAAGAPNNVDGITPVVGDRILVKNQGTATQNGIYIVVTVGTGANGAWIRATDFDASAEVTSGAFLHVEEGAQGDHYYMLTTNNPITLGVTGLTFVALPNSADLASTGLNLGASLVGINDAGTVYTATHVEGALQEVKLIADAALPKAGGTISGNIVCAAGETFDGRDLSVDGAKLDGVEALADVTDFANVNTALSGASASIAVNGQKLTGLAAGSGAGDSVRYEQVLLLAGGSMSGAVTMANNVAVNFTADMPVKYNSGIFSVHGGNGLADVATAAIDISTGVALSDAGTVASGYISLVTGNSDTFDAGAVAGATGAISLNTGDALDGGAGTSGSTGSIDISTGFSVDANSGSINFSTGNANAGAGTSGDVIFTIGTGNTRGAVKINAPQFQVNDIREYSVGQGTLINGVSFKNNEIQHDRFVKVNIAATGAAGGVADGTLDIDLLKMDGGSIGQAKVIGVFASATQYAGSYGPPVNTVTFSAPTVGSILASGNGWAVVKTDATGNFTCTLSDSADETVWVSAEAAPGGVGANEGCIVLESATDSATWSA